MIALLRFVLNVLVSPFKSKRRLEAENAAVRHQVVVLRRIVVHRSRRPAIACSLSSCIDGDDRFNDSTSRKSIKLTNNGLSLGLPNIRFESLTQICGERSISDEAAEVIGQLIIKNRFQSGRRWYIFSHGPGPRARLLIFVEEPSYV